MKVIALLLVVPALASGLDWTNLYAKWNTWMLDPFRWNSFFEIPRTVEEAISASWVETSGLSSLNLTTYCYPDDGQMCVLYDSYGHIAGFQAGLLRSDVDPTGNIYKTSDFNLYQNKTIFNKKYVTSTVYTVDPEILESGGRSDWNELTGTAGVWLETTNGYVTIPRNVTDLDPAWTQEECIEEMGTHYYYGMNTTLKCEDIQPWFLLYQDGELTGLGIQAFGSCTIESRSWCEGVPVIGIKTIASNSPQCLSDWTAEYGIISRHFYFTSKPWDVKC